MASSTPNSAAVNSVGGSNPSTRVTTRKKKLPKNAAGAKTDVAWNYGVSVEGNNRKIKCKFCEKLVNGSIYRLKHHLAGTSKDVGACTSVPDGVKMQMLKIVADLQQRLIKKSATVTEQEEEIAEVGSSGAKRVSDEVTGGSSSALFKRRCAVQTTINNVFKKSLKEDAHMAIAKFFFNNAISFNVARSEEYKNMFDLVAKHGLGFQPPSYHELRVKYLKQQVKLTNDLLEEHRAEWRRVGCSIMTDGWTDKRKRSILNFLVNSPKGTVFLKSVDASHISKTGEVLFKMIDEIVEEIGEKNVIQVLTDNAANCVAAGEMLMKKRKHLYWTPCAAHCIDLILEDLMKIDYHADTIPKGKKITTFIYGRTSLISLLQQHTKDKDLVRPGATRFATSYLTLACLHENKDSLVRMFTSKEWKSNRSAKTKDGKIVEEIVLDIKGFWKNVLTCLKGALPLVKVLRLVDSDQKPAMGFVYEAMDVAKEEIQEAFRNIRKRYNPYWKIIDARWNEMLHRPLHAAAYYLNPQMHYSPKFKADLEVKKGLMNVMDTLVRDKDERALIDRQVDEFRKRTGFFGSEMARINQDKKEPADWWETYGIEYPELQNFAIRILSLTASSSGCERNWSVFEMVHTKRRNRLKIKTMNDVVFVMVNSRLAKKKKLRKEREFEDLVSDSEWVSGDEDVDENTRGIEAIHLDEDSEDDGGEPDFDRMEMAQVPIFEDVAEHDGDGGEKGEEVDGGGGEDEVGGDGDGGEDEDGGDEEEDGDGEDENEDEEEDDDEGDDDDDEGDDGFKVAKYL